MNSTEGTHATGPLLPGTGLPGGAILPSTATVLMSPEGIRVILLGSTHVSFTSVSPGPTLIKQSVAIVVVLLSQYPD